MVKEKNSGNSKLFLKFVKKIKKKIKIKNSATAVAKRGTWNV